VSVSLSTRWYGLNRSELQTAENGRTIGFCYFLRLSHPVFGIVLHLSHSALPFWMCGQTLFKVGLLRQNTFPHPELYHTTAWCLLPISAQSHLTVATIFRVSAGAITTSMVDKFGEPKYRPFRAGSAHFSHVSFVWSIFYDDFFFATGIFIAFGLSGAIPAVHYACYGRLGKRRLLRLSRMADSNGSTYILGALLSCIPECYFPGKCDIWVRSFFIKFPPSNFLILLPLSNWFSLQFQSHKIFHVLVIAAAFVHYQGISEMAVYRLTNNQWSASTVA
jgi:predicted membrane channel-forming protein YqfA (hemolysin III family)